MSLKVACSVTRWADRENKPCEALFCVNQRETLRSTTKRPKNLCPDSRLFIHVESHHWKPADTSAFLVNHRSLCEQPKALSGRLQGKYHAMGFIASPGPRPVRSAVMGRLSVWEIRIILQPIAPRR